MSSRNPLKPGNKQGNKNSPKIPTFGKRQKTNPQNMGGKKQLDS
jgi:hypothetical protein